jgi:hypothetical protein
MVNFTNTLNYLQQKKKYGYIFRRREIMSRCHINLKACNISKRKDLQVIQPVASRHTAIVLQNTYKHPVNTM